MIFKTGNIYKIEMKLNKVQDLFKGFNMRLYIYESLTPIYNYS